MKFLIILICLFLATSVFAEVKLYRYSDIATGEERGVCYSDKDGNSSITNPNWNSEVIPENKKEHYIAIHNVQMKQKQQQDEQALKDKKDKAKAKLTVQGFTADEIKGIFGEK